MLLGIDIGTSAVKAVLLTEAGGVVAGASSSYEVDSPRPGWTEQPAERWWTGVIDAVGSLGARVGDVTAVGLSGQMHGSVLLDDAALAVAGAGVPAPVRPPLLWNDQRTAPMLPRIVEAAGGPRALVERTGNAALAGFTLPKVLWIREKEPEAFMRARMLLCPKDWVRLVLTGEPAIDVGDGAGTLLFDPAARTWDDSFAADLDLDPGLLPPVLESGAVAGAITAWAAEATGIPAGTPVVAGSGDNQCGAVGAGVLEPGLVLATLGTSGVIYAPTAEPTPDLPADSAVPPGRVHLMCAADGDGARTGGWSITGCTLSAAGALAWARSVLAPDVEYDALLAEAADAPPGCEGVRFVPHLTGERCPFPDPDARGAWTGLASRHDRGHLVRAVLEGVAASMGRILDIVRGLPVPVSHVRLGGGGQRSELWRRIQADAYRAPVARLDVEEGPAWGAAMIAGAGTGRGVALRDVCASALREIETIEPSPAGSAEAEAAAAVAHDLEPTWRALATVRDDAGAADGPRRRRASDG